MALTTTVSDELSRTPPHAETGANSEPVDLTDQTNYVPVRKIIAIFLGCATVSFTVLLDETIPATMLPQINAELGAGGGISWVATSFLLTTTAFQLLYGRLSDIWSRKTIFYTLMFIFFIGNLGSAFASTFIELLIFRAIAGIGGGGGLGTIAQIIVSDTVTLRERGKYQGVLGISVALANGIGPLIGGAFAENSTWRWGFRMMLPMTAFSSVMVYFLMPLKPVEGNWRVKLRRIDFVGSFLVLASSTLLVMALSWGGTQYLWSNAHSIAPLCIGVVIAVGFLLWETRPKYPLLPLYIFRNSVVNGAALSHGINGWLTVTQVFFLPTFYQICYGYSAVKSGVLLLALTVVQTLVSSASGLIVTWTGRYRELVLTGWVIWAIGLGLIASLTPSSSLGKQIGYSMLTGFGVGQTNQPSLVAMQAAVERKDMAVATGLRIFARSLGGVLGLAVSGSVVTNVYHSTLHKLSIPAPIATALIQDPRLAPSLISDPYALLAAQDGYRRGFKIVFIIMAALAGASFFVVLGLMTHTNLTREDDQRLKDEAKARIEMGDRGGHA